MRRTAPVDQYVRDRAEYRKLKYFSGYGEDVLVELIEKLVKSGKIIETESGGKIFYSFADEEEGKTVYNNMSLTRRRRLHTVMAEDLKSSFRQGRMRIFFQGLFIIISGVEIRRTQTGI